MTAHHMLHHLGNLKPTDSVLIHGGGGVGTQRCNFVNGQVLPTFGQQHRQEIPFAPMMQLQSTDTTKISLKLFALKPMVRC